MKKTLIAYYTGSGSSCLVAQEVRDQLVARGVSVEMHRLTEATKEDLMRKAEACLDLILIYAVHTFNAPGLVYEWLSALEEQTAVAGQQKKAMIISVSGGGEMLCNTACRITAKRWLVKKGYNVVTEAMAVMPNNWMSPTPLEVSKALIQILPNKVNQWLEAYTQNQPNPVLRVKLLDRMITRLGRLKVKGAKKFGKNIQVSEACNECGWCESHCPTSNIRLAKSSGAEASRPEFGKACDFCLGCIYGCPQKSLTPGKCKFAVIQAGYPLATYQQISEKSLTDSELKLLLMGRLWKRSLQISVFSSIDSLYILIPTVIIIMANRGINCLMSNTSLVISLNPQVAGNKRPTISMAPGSIVTGNIMPDSIIEGKKITCATMVNLDVFFINNPKTVPVVILAMIKIEIAKKYIPRLEGIFAPNANGAKINIIKLIKNRCKKAEMELLTAATQIGIFPIWYAFFISLPYTSTKGEEAPSIVPIVIPKTFID